MKTITKLIDMKFWRASVAPPLVLHVQVACAHVWRAPRRSPLAVVGEARAVVGEDHIVDGHELDLVHEVLEVGAVVVLVLHKAERREGVELQRALLVLVALVTA